MSYEKALKQLICINCHVAILEPHPEEKFRDQGYFKCCICGYTKQINERKRKSDIIKKRKRS